MLRVALTGAINVRSPLECIFVERNANEIKELETIIRTTSLYYDRSDKDKLIIQIINSLAEQFLAIKK